MTKKHSTKKALMTSMLSLLLCFSMLLGTTYAWFTDSVTSANNIITAGNLDVELYYQAEGQTDWTKVTDTTNVFKENTFWEPGHTEVVKLKVVNEGSLALKYTLGVNVANEVGSINVNDKEFKLSDFIKFGIVDGAQTYTRDQAIAAVDATATALKTAYNSTVTALDAKNDTDSDEKIVTMVVYMPTSVGNDANYKKGAAVPTINLGINLFATQQTAESDSFNNQYDQAAEYLNKDENGNWLITGAADLRYLAQQVNGGNSYKNEKFLLTADIDLGGQMWTPIGHASHSFSALFDGNGHTVSNFVVDVDEYAGLFGDARNGGDIKNLTVKDAIINATDRAGAVIGAGYTNLDNCHAVDCIVTVTPKLLANGNYDGGAKAGGVMGQVWEGAGNGLNNCTATNVKVIGYRDIGAVLGMAHNNNVVTDCKAYDSEVSYLYLGADQVYDDGTPNENIGEVVGRVQSSATVTGSVSNNVKTDAVYVYGLKLIPDGTASKIVINDTEGFLNLPKLFADWTALFTDGNGTTYTNYANGAGADYYYSGRWTMVLDADIDLNNATIDPITIKHPVSAGSLAFDGNNHTISNAKIVMDATTENEAGLFSANYVAFKNLKLDNIHVTGSNVGNSTAGVLAGSCNCSVSNITITNSSVTGGKYTGGVIGYGYTSVTDCTLTNVTVKGGYKLGGLIGYICATSPNTGDVTGNTLTDCTVDGIGGGVFAGGKDKYVIGQVVGNYNCNGTCNNNTVTNMTSSVTAAIGEIEAGKTVTQ